MRRRALLVTYLMREPSLLRSYTQPSRLNGARARRVKRLDWW
jgi:hypothetical protein